MLGLIRAAVLGFLILSAFYVLMSLYARSVRREELEKQWDGEPGNEGLGDEARGAFVSQGMAEYHGSLRRKLILLVYIIPTVAFVAIIYIVNSQ